MTDAKARVCMTDITYIQRGGETVTRTVHSRDVEKRRNGDIVYKYWDEQLGMTTVWVSARYLISTNTYHVELKDPADHD